MSPFGQKIEPHITRFLRTRGDEPDMGAYTGDFREFSPHTRG